MTARWTTAFLDLPTEAFDAGTTFWAAVTGTHLSPSRGGDGEFATLLPVEGDACLRVQRVAGAGGCHLDLHVDGDLDAFAATATGLGATVQDQQPGLVVLRSPGGLPFCVVAHRGEAVVPGPVDLGAGGLARLDQLCLDIPAERFDVEAAFWADLLGWAPRSSSYPEFAGLVFPDGIPVHLLLQRRAVSAPGDVVTAHVDLACADPQALAPVHVQRGARVDADHGQWVRMVDPVGRSYCLTRRSPT